MENKSEGQLAIERIRKANEVNQRRITVNLGLLKSAITEIEIQSKINGKGVFTDMVLNSLKAAIGEDSCAN
ncbi:hypothetical protein ACTUSX_11430 [Pantoea ananatis]|uniref:hypothetical protein n=1 Tax=Pantoea ananas TaxID=553 RepID=UPI003FA4256B